MLLLTADADGDTARAAILSARTRVSQKIPETSVGALGTSAGFASAFQPVVKAAKTPAPRAASKLVLFMPSHSGLTRPGGGRRSPPTKYSPDCPGRLAHSGPAPPVPTT